MATLAPIITFSEPVTRADLYTMWSTAALGTITADDLAPGTLSVVAASTISEAMAEPSPGQIIYSQAERLLYCWHDEVDDTGVSLWLSIGPDRFETACLAEEPIGGGMLVKSTSDRKIKLLELGDDPALCIGLNQSNLGGQGANGGTTESGAWCRVGVDGILFGILTESTASLASHWWSPVGGNLALRSPIHAGTIGGNDPNTPDVPKGDIVGDMISPVTPGAATRIVFHGYRKDSI